jgi:hypothetical protein
VRAHRLRLLLLLLVQLRHRRVLRHGRHLILVVVCAAAASLASAQAAETRAAGRPAGAGWRGDSALRAHPTTGRPPWCVRRKCGGERRRSVGAPGYSLNVVERRRL